MTLETQLVTLNRIANGFFKKYVLADNLFIFTQYSNLSMLAQQNLHGQIAMPMFWLAALLELIAIYLDFSGYCDIAIGTAKLMGIEIPENFNAPFLARDLQEFWSRWHMSLTNFIKDYIFTPLARLVLFSTPSSARWFAITGCYLFCMILIALWHGTTIGYLIFGILHATALIIIQLKKRINIKPLPVPLACCINYCFFSFTVWMAALPDEQIFPVLKTMFGLEG